MMTKSDLLYALLSVMIAFIIASITLVAMQRQMIYHPRRYPDHIELPKTIKPIDYIVNKKHQTAFFVSKAHQPTTLWIFLNGNAALALQWLPLLNAIDTSQCGFLLIDYPGYGFNQGSPNQQSIRESVQNAVHEIKARYPSITAVNTIGQSLGAAVAVDTASDLRPSSLILISPFTSLYDMASIAVGQWWSQLLSPFLWDSFHTQDTLPVLRTKLPDLRVMIIHGTKERVVPFSMGKSLAQENDWISFVSIIGMGHDMDDSATQLVRSQIENQCKE